MAGIGIDDNDVIVVDFLAACLIFASSMPLLSLQRREAEVGIDGSRHSLLAWPIGNSIRQDDMQTMVWELAVQHILRRFTSSSESASIWSVPVKIRGILLGRPRSASAKSRR